jgi:bifunctional non-homologous end joining protein LigD
VGLKEYRRKRDFERTPEPTPSRAARGDKSQFVVHKHEARNVHYDLRLRVGDVLKSWAVPKGPSLDPREKRLAIEVEDHPLEYATFEGVIPEGQYGAGPVMIWDQGRWSPEEGTAAAAVKAGMLKFRLNGQRLKGRWMLVRTKRGEEKKHWLLIKERDSEASPGVHAETFATSVASGRTMDEISSGSAPRPPELVRAAELAASVLKGARESAMPARIKPQLAVPGSAVPGGSDWLHEIKFDGYRLVIHRKGDSVKILTRSGLDWTAKMPDLVGAVRERLSVDAVLDGEAAILDSRGVSDFQALQNAIHGRRSKSIVFLAFDLPWCDGYDLTKSPLEQRKELLAQIIGSRQEGRLRLSEHFEGNGPAAFEEVCKHGLEGLVSKRRDSPYVQARVPAWVKVKCFNQQEFVIGGFSAPEGSREQFGALLLGYFEAGSFRFAGKVGTGFSTETLRKLASLLRTRIVAKPAFVNPPTGADARGVTWVRPELVAQVQFRDWTAEDVIRHTSFRGLREDIEAAAVRREPPTARDAAPEVKKVTKPVKKASKARPRPGSFRLTNPDRVVYPDRGAGYSLTKRQVAEYYEAVADRMLPHVANRPLSVLRCPDGEGKKSFFQKHPAKGMPTAVDGVDIDDDGDTVRHLMIRDAAGLLGLVQMSVLEFHPWGAPAKDPDQPDRLVFDLDPGDGVSWHQVVEGAQMLRDALAQVKLRGFARLSGGKGVHIVVPLRPGHAWAEATQFTKAVADTMVRLAPRRFVAIAGAAHREGRIFIDYLRNVRGATAIASYSTRARPGAPVALPVAWDELRGLGSAAALAAPAVIRRVKTEPDPWEGMAATAGVLPAKHR